jgi:predicted nucleotidyltransferase component of viral defense system
MDMLNYSELYALQDKVMSLVFRTENIFYLTGGTCLGRFYVEKRYSDALDFFTNTTSRYAFAVRNIKAELQKHFILSAELEARDFTRFRINRTLQIDFVNDKTYRDGDPQITPKGFIIDNILNILSNKLTAVIGRDNPKDVFDIFLIAAYYNFSWEHILKAAHLKAAFSDEELIVRLKTFPRQLLNDIKIKDRAFLDSFDAEFPKLIDEIFRKAEHKALNI